MKRQVLLLWLAMLVLSLCLLLIPGRYTAAAWITAAVTVLAFAVSALLWSRSAQQDADARFFHFPAWMIGGIYLSVQMLICLLIGLFGGTLPLQTALLINLLPALIAVLFITALGLGRKYAKGVDSRQKDHRTKL